MGGGGCRLGVCLRNTSSRSSPEASSGYSGSQLLETKQEPKGTASLPVRERKPTWGPLRPTSPPFSFSPSS